MTRCDLHHSWHGVIMYWHVTRVWRHVSAANCYQHEPRLFRQNSEESQVSSQSRAITRDVRSVHISRILVILSSLSISTSINWPLGSFLYYTKLFCLGTLYSSLSEDEDAWMSGEQGVSQQMTWGHSPRHCNAFIVTFPIWMFIFQAIHCTMMQWVI